MPETTYNLSALDRAASAAEHYAEKAVEFASAGDFEAAYEASAKEAYIAGAVIAHFMDRAEWPEGGLAEDEVFEGDPEDVDIEDVVTELTCPPFLMGLLEMLAEAREEEAAVE